MKSAQKNNNLNCPNSLSKCMRPKLREIRHELQMFCEQKKLRVANNLIKNSTKKCHNMQESIVNLSIESMSVSRRLIVISAPT